MYRSGPEFQANRRPATAVTPCGGCGGGGLLALQLLPPVTDSYASWVCAGGLGWLFMTSQTR
jgi:hypothetical protein